MGQKKKQVYYQVSRWERKRKTSVSLDTQMGPKKKTKCIIRYLDGTGKEEYGCYQAFIDEIGKEKQVYWVSRWDSKNQVYYQVSIDETVKEK